jgi:predicted AlkP superfamily phosphohydrolase/phosphomutase
MADRPTHFQPRFRHGVAISLLVGHLIAIPPVLATVRMNRLVAWESLVLWVEFSVLMWAVTAVALAAALALVRAVKPALCGRLETWWVAACLPALFYYLVHFHRRFLRTSGLDTAEPERSLLRSNAVMIAEAVLLVIVAIAVLWGLTLLVGRLAARRRRAALVWFLLFEGGMILLSGAVIAYTHSDRRPQDVRTSNASPVRDATNGRVFLIGVDGADWAVIDLLRRNGELPHWQALIDQGVHARLETLIPTYSPRIWTSIFTGKSPEQHGIRDFVMYRAPGFERYVYFPEQWAIGVQSLVKWKVLSQIPTSSRYRTARPLWDITREAGIPTLHVGTMSTWPVDPVVGLMVTDRLMESVEEYRETGAPEDLARDLKHISSDPIRLLQLLEEQVTQDVPQDEDELHASVFWPLFDEVDPRLSILYLPRVDRTSHKRFCCNGRCLPDRDACHEPVIQAYLRSDRVLGRVRELAGPDDVVMVYSDHGFGLYRWNLGFRTAHHASDGVFVAAGGPIAHLEGESIEVYDVLPTVLYLLGLPRGADMSGRVRTDYLDPAFVSRHPLREVSTYERATYPLVPADETDFLEEDLEEKLRGLGYIN